MLLLKRSLLCCWNERRQKFPWNGNILNILISFPVIFYFGSELEILKNILQNFCLGWGNAVEPGARTCVSPQHLPPRDFESFAAPTVPWKADGETPLRSLILCLWSSKEQGPCQQVLAVCQLAVIIPCRIIPAWPRQWWKRKIAKWVWQWSSPWWLPRKTLFQSFLQRKTILRQKFPLTNTWQQPRNPFQSKNMTDTTVEAALRNYWHRNHLAWVIKLTTSQTTLYKYCS